MLTLAMRKDTRHRMTRSSFEVDCRPLMRVAPARTHTSLQSVQTPAFAVHVPTPSACSHGPDRLYVIGRR